MNMIVGINLNGSWSLSMSKYTNIGVKMSFTMNLSKSRKLSLNMIED